MKPSFHLWSKPETTPTGHSLNGKFRYLLLSASFFILIAFLLSSCDTKSHWLRGNMHTHTLWSDGDDFPENVARWYKENGYDFLVFTDHNVILDGESWRRLPETHPAIPKYIEAFGNDWLEKRHDDKDTGYLQVRLKPLNEFRSKFEEPGKFLLIMGNEITCPYAVHMTSFGQDRILPAPKRTQEERSKMIGDVIAMVGDYRKESGRNTYPALAHPNFRWAITAEMILDNPDLRFFEVYNGHPQVNNNGDSYRSNTDRIWDIVLANRLREENGKVLYGLAVDDGHSYHKGDAYPGKGPGKGWVMVNSKKLSPESLLDALDKGDFYATTGVKINSLQFKGKTIKLEIEQQEGVEYLTEFIGTRGGFDSNSYPTVDSTGTEIPNTTRTYSKQIGEIFASSKRTKSSYTFSGDELYVRIRVTSSADHKDPLSGNILGKQKAWLQPLIPGKI